MQKRERKLKDRAKAREAAERKRKPRSADAQPPTLPPGTTVNGAKIFKLMEHHKVKGNFRDHVVFVGDQMLDNYGTYTVKRETQPGQPTVALVHKQHLKHLIGEEAAARFWNEALGRRTNHGSEHA